MSMRVKPNDLVGNGPGSTCLENTARVLVLSDSSKQCWLIYLPALKKEAGKEQQIQDYVKAPFTIETDKFYEHLSSGAIVVLNTRAAVALSDADRLAEARPRGKEQSVIRDIQKRDKRFSAIRSLVCEEDSNVLRNIEDLLSDPALPQKIVEAAQHHASSDKSVRHFLNLFLAGGSVKGALCTRYPFCGNPGQPKAQSRHLGRKPNLYKQGLIESDGYVLTELCKKKIEQGFRLIRHGTTEHDAYITVDPAGYGLADGGFNATTKALMPVFPNLTEEERWKVEDSLVERLTNAESIEELQAEVLALERLVRRARAVQPDAALERQARTHLPAVQQPRAAGGLEGLSDDFEIHVRPVIVITRHAVERHANLPQHFERLRQMLRLLDQVAGETREVRLQGVDARDDFGEQLAVAFVMHIGEMHQPVRRSLAQTHGAFAQPARLHREPIGEHRRRRAHA